MLLTIRISWPLTTFDFSMNEILVKNSYRHSTGICFDVSNAKEMENFRFKVMTSNCSISLNRLNSSRKVVYTLDEMKLVYWAKTDTWRIMQSRIKQKLQRTKERKKNFTFYAANVDFEGAQDILW